MMVMGFTISCINSVLMGQMLAISSLFTMWNWLDAAYSLAVMSFYRMLRAKNKNTRLNFRNHFFEPFSKYFWCDCHSIWNQNGNVGTLSLVNPFPFRNDRATIRTTLKSFERKKILLYTDLLHQYASPSSWATKMHGCTKRRCWILVAELWKIGFFLNCTQRPWIVRWC